MNAKKTVSMKAVALLLTLVLLIGCVAGGTFALLMTESETVTNTFVAGNIGKLNLKETTGSEYIITPGVAIEKNPTVTFTDYNIPAYVFLKVDAADWTVSGSGTTYTYSMGNGKMSWTLDGWTKLEDGVYYKEVAAGAGNQSWSIISGNSITVSSEITNNDIGNYENSLTFSAYAIQQGGFASVAAAWTEASKLAD